MTILKQTIQNSFCDGNGPLDAQGLPMYNRYVYHYHRYYRLSSQGFLLIWMPCRHIQKQYTSPWYDLLCPPLFPRKDDPARILSLVDVFTCKIYIFEFTSFVGYQYCEFDIIVPDIFPFLIIG